MSATFKFYVVDEKKLPSEIEGVSDQEKYEKLLKAVVSNGSSWALLELKQVEFSKSLEKIDSQIGAIRFLPIQVFHNSPHRMLANNENCPFFGYFDPSQVKDLHLHLEQLPSAWLEELLNSEDEITKEVLYAFQSSAEEASKNGKALAVIHG
jgi:hypothetical protein